MDQDGILRSAACRGPGHVIVPSVLRECRSGTTRRPPLPQRCAQNLATRGHGAMPASHRDTGRQPPRSKLRGPRVFRTRMDVHESTLPAHRSILQNLAAHVLPATLVCQDAQSALGIVRRAVYPKRMLMHMLILSVLILNRLPRMLRPRSPKLLQPPGELSPQQSDEQCSFCGRPQRRSSSANPWVGTGLAILGASCDALHTYNNNGHTGRI